MRPKHWVTLNQEATAILSVHYAHTRLDKMAEDKRAAFIAEAWWSSLPEGEDPAKYQLMTFGRWVYYVDLNNKAAIDRPVEEEPSTVAIEAEHQMAEDITAASPEPEEPLQLEPAYIPPHRPQVMRRRYPT